MAKLIVKSGSTSRLEHVFILDSTSTTGAGKTGLTNASVTLYYWRPGDTSIGAQTGTMSAGTLGTWSSFGFKEMDATNLPGFYEVGLPNAVFAAGANHAVVMIKGTGIAPVTLEYQLVAFDPDSGVNLGLSALPNTAVTTNGSLITSGTGTAQLSVASGQVTVGTLSAGVITSSSLTTGVIGDDVWTRTIGTYAGTSTYGYRVLRSDATSHSGDVQVSGNGSSNNHNRIDSDVHAIASDTTSATNLKNALNGTGGVIISATLDALSTTERNAISDALLGRNIGGGSSTGRLVKDAFRALRNKSEIVGSTLTVYQEDDAATAWTATVASSASAVPVTGIDPA